MTEQLFRTTDEDGDFYLTLAKDSCLSKHGFRCFLRVGSSIHIPEDSLTDLRPVKVVDMDAVVIDKDYAEKIVSDLIGVEQELRVIYQNHYRADQAANAYTIVKQALSQLSTPAEPATGGEMKSPTHETTEISSTSLGEDENAHLLTCWRGGVKNCKCHPAPTSPKGVWIELSEYDRINVETAMKSILLPTPLDEIIAKIYNAIKLTPTQSESEKFFAHLNNGEVGIDITDSFNTGCYRIVILPKAGE